MKNKEIIKIDKEKIKKIRKITHCGLLECKKFLLESKGDIELAIKNMRKSGIIRSINKYKNNTINGIILTEIKENIAVILELNSNTDFVAKNSLFQNFGKEIIAFILDKKITNIEKINKIFENKKNILISQFKENINIRRLSYLEGDNLGFYLHNNMKVGTIVSAKNLDINSIKKIAMHITASKPEYIDIKDVPQKIIDSEKKIQIELAKKYQKNNIILEKIVDGQIKKIINNIVLNNQFFIFDTKKTLFQVLKEKNAKIISFFRFELGEKIKNN